MRKMLFLVYILLGFSYIYAQGYTLNVNLKDGTRVVYKLNDITKIDFSGITSVKDAKKVQGILNAFKLHQNYPNPFNPSTTIVYETPTKGNVQVSIYDINGRLIKTLINAPQSAGAHRVTWQGFNQSGQKVASGVYIYMVKFNNAISSKKMLLLK